MWREGTENIVARDDCIEGLDIHSEKETFSIPELTELIKDL